MTLGPLMVDVAGKTLTAEDRELLRHPLVGSVILFTRNFEDPEQLAALVDDIRALRSPPLLVAVDHEGGRVQRFRNGFSILPPARRIGLEYDVDARQGLAMARSLAWLMAAELRSLNIDFSFAPCVDLDYGISEIIGDRAYHAQAETVSRLAIAVMQGMRQAGMAATAKHFPGHGAVVADSHLALPIDRRELADLEADLLPYRRLIPNELAGVMMGHVLFPAVDAVPASFSKRWVETVLRGDLDFRGVIFADDLTMEGATAMGGIVARAEAALEAGCDVLPVCNRRASVIELLDGLTVLPGPASQMRILRMRGKDAPDRPTLLASARISRGPRLVAARRPATGADAHMNLDPAFLRLVVDGAPEGIVICDAQASDCPVIYVNAAFQVMTGYGAAELLGSNLRILQGADRDQEAPAPSSRGDRARRGLSRAAAQLPQERRHDLERAVSAAAAKRRRRADALGRIHPRCQRPVALRGARTGGPAGMVA